MVGAGHALHLILTNQEELLGINEKDDNVLHTVVTESE